MNSCILKLQNETQKYEGEEEEETRKEAKRGVWFSEVYLPVFII
jgi:hypothetical protein